jgi:predicted nuclease with TOPRIM domain
MSKLNKKQIEANLRNKLAAQYKEKTEQLKNEKAVLEKRYNEMWERARKAEIERDELKEKVAQYEDWNNRLQEFMGMSDEDRKAYVENLKKTKELNDAINRFGFYGSMLSRLFN